ncbi:hypothetical protein GX50_02204 [[Emmonsia] crescens]|uniref:Uncharacterized protein n=1 Tax=[Emmonsia] crescens TaxID=73230 RepID=A0A2B7ZMT6_9EURO|nr:hypothetical protein GX50_02204 [Emmonsia crescens]
MFRRPQDHEPDPEISQLGRILSPLRIYTWGPSAMSYLGVPIVIRSAALATAQYDTYGNILYPHRQTLLESLIRATVVEETNAGFTSWAASMKAWVSMMVGYLGVENDILDDCLDEQVATWYSTHFGRIHESKYGPFNRRISKHALGLGKNYLLT